MIPQIGIAEQGEAHGRRQQGDVVELATPETESEQRENREHRRQRHRHMQKVDGGEVDLLALLARGTHRLGLRGDVALDDAIGVAEPFRAALAEPGARTRNLPEDVTQGLDR